MVRSGAADHAVNKPGGCFGSTRFGTSRNLQLGPPASTLAKVRSQPPRATTASSSPPQNTAKTTHIVRARADICHMLE